MFDEDPKDPKPDQQPEKSKDGAAAKPEKEVSKETYRFTDWAQI